MPKLIKSVFSYIASFVVSFIVMTIMWVAIIILKETVMKTNPGATIVVVLSALAFMPKYRSWRQKTKIARSNNS